MKNLFLFIPIVVLAISLNSCSSDSNSADSGSLSFKVNGVEKKFTVLASAENGYMFVNGFTGDAKNPTESVEFEMYLIGDSNINIIDDFIYRNPNEVNGSTTILSNITSKNVNSAEGTFSGTIHPFAGADLIISEGKFSLKSQKH